jgi:hypothetical protein
VDFSLEDDSMGESLGAGLDSSALGISGDQAFSLDFLGEEPLQGSNIALDFSDGLASNARISDLGSLTDDLSHDVSLSGVSDPAPHWSLDEGYSLNGSGTASPMYAPHNYEDVSALSTLYSSVQKFGTAAGSLLASHQATPVTYGQAIPNVNPNKSSLTSISGAHLTVLLVAVVIVAGVVAFGSQGS